MSVQEIILFFSAFSKNCALSLQMVKNITNVKTTCMRMDTKYIRDIIQKNRFLNIRSVPTLLIIYTEGNIQLFEGKKTELWLQNFIQNQNSEETSIDDDLNNEFSETNVDDIDTEQDFETLESLETPGMKFMSAKDSDGLEYLSSLKKDNTTSTAVSLAQKMETERNSLDEKQKAMWTQR
jgi:hypothetical protein